MRLINTLNNQLEVVPSCENIQYVILSHRWERDEVTFEDYQDIKYARNLKGYQKIVNLCQIARESGIHYVWIDTCCIDKKSSAELSEALNSMFLWYQRATICAVYLSDVHSQTVVPTEFRSSLWFTRGWTLQELLAPKHMIFYNSSWNVLGRKPDLLSHLVAATGISFEALNGANILTFPISQRMSWAAKRETTRVEDRAYSLMGIFNVNMPMLYGEGEKAFVRLQEEILRHSDDHTIFAWSGVTNRHSGLLAPSLECFATTQRLKPVYPRGQVFSSYSMTNQGLSIDLDLSPWSPNIYIARLNCTRELTLQNLTKSENSEGSVGIYLSRVGDRGHYRRIRLPGDGSDLLVKDSSNMADIMLEFKLCRICVRQSDLATFLPNPTEEEFERGLNFQLTPSLCVRSPIDVMCDGSFDPINWTASFDLEPQWEGRQATFKPKSKSWGRLLSTNLSNLDHNLGTLVLGFDFEFAPVCVIEHTEKHAKASTEYQPSPSIMYDPNVQKPISRVNCKETQGWDQGSGSMTSGNMIYLSPMGLWAMKGHTSKGLDVVIGEKPTKENQQPASMVNILIHPSPKDPRIWQVECFKFRS